MFPILSDICILPVMAKYNTIPYIGTHLSLGHITYPEIFPRMTEKIKFLQRHSYVAQTTTHVPRYFRYWNEGNIFLYWHVFICCPNNDSDPRYCPTVIGKNKILYIGTHPHVA